MKYLILVLLILGAASAATYFRYGSLHPCDWLIKDMAAESELPELVVEGQVRGGFLLDGITEPTPQDCLLQWWAFKTDGLEEAKK